MAKYYQDFVGLNTFIYEVNGYDTSVLRTVGVNPVEIATVPLATTFFTSLAKSVRKYLCNW